MPDRIKRKKIHPRKNQDGITRVLLIDGCITFRRGLLEAIKETQDLQVVELAATAAQVYNENFENTVDVAVVDVDLLDQSGIALCFWLNEHYPEMSLLLLTDRDWDVYLLAAKETFAAGLILRNSPTQEIIQFIRHAKTGNLFSPDQLQRIEAWKKSIGQGLKSLSSREWDVMWQVVAGLSNRDIAKKLRISENSIEKYMTRLFQKFGQNSRSTLLVFIYSSHLDVFNKVDDQMRIRLLTG
jgi:DNA-binding NarL/FixJ family response regulator